MRTRNDNAHASRRALGFALGVCLLLSFSACATVGREFETASVYKIQPGKTTQADILDMFGLPWRVGIDDGKLTWTYGHYHYNVFNEMRTKDLVVRFDANNVVTSYTFNTTDIEEMKKSHGPR